MKPIHPESKILYPLPLSERKRRLEQPTYEEIVQDDARDEVERNLSFNSR